MSPSESQRQRPPEQIVRVLVPAILGAVVVAFGIPLVSGVAWGDVGRVIGRVSPLSIAGLTLIWLAGLWTQTIAVAAGMPGLSRPRAFFLNLTGSAVSNLIPLGGAAGTALNLLTCRRWGFTVPDFVRWALVTNFWDTAVKVLLPGVAAGWLLIDGREAGPHQTEAALGGLAVLLGYVVMGWLLLHRRWGVVAVARAADRMVRVMRSPGAPKGPTFRPETFVGAMRSLVRQSYWRLTEGKIEYAALQAVLLWGCLLGAGVRVPAAVAFAAFAVERMTSIAVVTPGASGLAEMGSVGVLLSLGVVPVHAVAGVMLYRGFVFWLEIPTGAALLGLEVLLRQRGRHRAKRAAAGLSAARRVGTGR